mmetsp:Transcript_30681/g.51836  ORF Transcript_30681/g.51836 Transcript_30681/m.51836 type:complete len:207 (-) Transcript_30681:412-1032(-)
MALVTSTVLLLVSLQLPPPLLLAFLVTMVTMVLPPPPPPPLCWPLRLSHVEVHRAVHRPNCCICSRDGDDLAVVHHIRPGRRPGSPTATASNPWVRHQQFIQFGIAVVSGKELEQIVVIAQVGGGIWCVAQQGGQRATYFRAGGHRDVCWSPKPSGSCCGDAHCQAGHIPIEDDQRVLTQRLRLRGCINALKNFLCAVVSKSFEVL